MLAVALSGVVGRNLYQQVPRKLLGEALNADEMESRNEEIMVTLTNTHGVGDKLVLGLEKMALGGLENRPAPVASSNRWLCKVRDHHPSIA
ncbi:MAG: hypothetical protein ACI9UQ_002160 [Candidatus Krumholzibacteriia bacterium]|jgi:hypothetical protein